ncbi:hypothetical protein VTK26DRAFT_7880 [Humicola hyalothermophila]
MENPTQHDFDPTEVLPRSERAKIHVFCVDGHHISRKLNTKMIGRRGFQVTAVESPEECLRLIMAAMERSHPTPDIILMATNKHTNASAIDVFEGTRILRQEAPFKDYCSQMVIVGVRNPGQADERCLAVGMDDEVYKPLKPWTTERNLVRWAMLKRAVAEEPEDARAEGQEAAPEERNGHCQEGIRARL